MRIIQILVAAVLSLLTLAIAGAETLEAIYQKNPRSMKTFSYVNMECAVHYLAYAAKIDDSMAKKMNRSKDELVALYVKASQFHAIQTAYIQGLIHSKDNPPFDTKKYSEQLMITLIQRASDSDKSPPTPSEYLSAQKICQSIQENPKSYLSKLDSP